MASIQAFNQGYDLSRRSQVSRAARELIRYVHSHGLENEGRLPPQNELAREIGFSNDTLNEAMRTLVAGGVLTRKRRVGTVVADADRPLKGLWRVAIATLPEVNSEPYYMQLLHQVQMYLGSAGCVTSSHMRTEPFSGLRPQMRDFEGLGEQIARGEVDGVLIFGHHDPGELSGKDLKGIPVCHVGAWDEAPCGVVIDTGHMAREALKLLAGQGCKRIAYVGPLPSPYLLQDRGWDEYRQAMLGLGKTQKALRRYQTTSRPHDGLHLAEKLLVLPPKQRPDGLVVCNDWVAMGLTAGLAATRDYRPAIAVQTNKQAPLAFASPVIHFEVDVEEMAASSVKMLVQMMRNPLLPPRREWVLSQLSMEEPSLMVSVPSTLETKPERSPLIEELV